MLLRPVVGFLAAIGLEVLIPVEQPASGQVRVVDLGTAVAVIVQLPAAPVNQVETEVGSTPPPWPVRPTT